MMKREYVMTYYIMILSLLPVSLAYAGSMGESNDTNAHLIALLQQRIRYVTVTDIADSVRDYTTQALYILARVSDPTKDYKRSMILVKLRKDGSYDTRFGTRQSANLPQQIQVSPGVITIDKAKDQEPYNVAIEYGTVHVWARNKHFRFTRDGYYCQ